MWCIILSTLLLIVTPLRARLSNVAFPEKYENLAAEIRDKCLQSLGLTLDDHENFIFNQDRNTMCYISCVFIEAGWMSDTGIMEFKDNHKHRIPGDPEEIQKYIDNGCPLQPDGDNCEIAYKVLDCYKKISETVYFP